MLSQGKEPWRQVKREEVRDEEMEKRTEKWTKRERERERGIKDLSRESFGGGGEKKRKYTKSKQV